MLKKLLLSRKAFTLLEVLLAITIIAAIALPLLSVFLQSVKTNQLAKGVLSANYISQDYIEKLDTVDYQTALQERPTLAQRDGYYLSVKITPYGTAASTFSSGCAYAQLVFFASGKVLAVMPDGQWRMYSSVPSSISLSVSGGIYTFSAGSLTMSGAAGSSSCALMINAMNKLAGTESSVTLGSTCKALCYCKKAEANSISITGAAETYLDIIGGETSLILVRADVYETASDTEPVATSEGYVNIRNW